MSALLSIQGLSVELQGPYGRFRAVESLSFEIAAGEALGIVGESGSGKTMTSLAIMGLLPRGARAAGSVSLDGRDLMDSRPRDWNALRGREIGMVFQDPMSSFNPVRTIGSLIVESIRRHQGLGSGAARAAAIEALRSAGVPQPEARIDAYPHQLSGGLRQRAMIALALANAPKLLIADEPTTALDATVQAQILDLLKARREGRATILITHNLGVAAELCQRILVMRRGACVEQGSARQVLADPRHDYTRALIAAVPRFADAAHG